MDIDKRPKSASLVRLQASVKAILDAYEHGGKIQLAHRLKGILDLGPDSDLAATVKEILGGELSAEDLAKIATLQRALEFYPGDDSPHAKPADSR